MPNYTYPASDFDSPDKLLQVLGSFWSLTYGEQGLLRSVINSRGQLDLENHRRLRDIVAAASRYTVPVHLVDNWYALTLQESKLNQTVENYAKFDGVYAFDTSGLHYDLTLAGKFCWDADTSLADVRVVLNRINDPSAVWIKGVDFLLRNNTLMFFQNPFESEFVAKRDVYSGSEIVDREITLWLYRGEFDFDTIYRQFGYVVGIRLPSSENYRKLLNAVYDAIVEGTTQRNIEEAFSALCDVPLVVEPSETVELVTQDRRHKLVITDKNAYRFSLAADITVAVGDVLTAGQSMTETVKIYEFNRGQVPTDLHALAMGRGFLANGYYGDVCFENDIVEVIAYEEDPTGYTRVEFEITGLPGDVNKFWDDVHAAGVAKGETLAMLMDQRTNKVGQPTGVALPKFVNPLEFLLTNVLRSNVSLVKLRPASFGENALSLHAARVLRKIVPPHTAIIVLTELEIPAEQIIMETSGTEDTPGYEETVGLHLGSKISEVLDPDMVRESVRLKTIHGRCG